MVIFSFKIELKVSNRKCISHIIDIYKQTAKSQSNNFKICNTQENSLVLKALLIISF